MRTVTSQSVSFFSQLSVRIDSDQVAKNIRAASHNWIVVIVVVLGRQFHRIVQRLVVELLGALRLLQQQPARGPQDSGDRLRRRLRAADALFGRVDLSVQHATLQA